MTDEDATNRTGDDAIARYAKRVERSPHNLLSARGILELRTRHIPEASAFARILPPGPGRVLDVGTGGGLPGVVVAIVRPDLEVHVLEATSKKAAFLTGVSSELEGAFTVHSGRAEELVQRSELRGAFDVVTARAVAPLERLAPLCVGFLRPGGRLYAIKGARWPEELALARGVIAKLGMEVVTTPDDVDPVAPEPHVVILQRRS
ncbi:MAG: 16S rRNA (guanine(527)-N(7))-methyltransferase RsmG [Nitriliruptoraceae bacterium]